MTTRAERDRQARYRDWRASGYARPLPSGPSKEQMRRELEQAWRNTAELEGKPLMSKHREELER